MKRVERKKERHWKETKRKRQRAPLAAVCGTVSPPEGLRCFSQRRRKVKVSGAGWAGESKREVWPPLGVLGEASRESKEGEVNTCGELFTSSFRVGATLTMNVKRVLSGGDGGIVSDPPISHQKRLRLALALVRGSASERGHQRHRAGSHPTRCAENHGAGYF